MAAGDTQHHDIAFPDIDSDEGTREVTYEVDLLLAEATAWAPAGYELAFGQLTDTLNPEGDITGNDQGDGRATVTLSRWNAGIRRDDEEILMSRTQGGIVSWKRNGREMVIRRPEIVTFRPLTDNDRGNRSGYDRAAWFAAGRYAVVTDTSITQSDDGGLTAAYRYELADPDHTPVSVTYRVTPGMRMQLTVEYPGNATGAASLPAFGIEWELPGEYQHLRYYGTGPEETYRDRKQGGKLGIWDTTSEASTAPYLMVQETGSHEDVRWLEATDIQGHGLRIIQRGDRHFTASLLPWNTYTIEAARRHEDLPAPRHNYLRLLAAQMGVGGDDSWGAPVHTAYQLPSNSSDRQRAAACTTMPPPVPVYIHIPQAQQRHQPGADPLHHAGHRHGAQGPPPRAARVRRGQGRGQCRPSSSIHHGRGDETGSRHQLGRQQNVPSHPTLMLQPIDQGGECHARQLPLIDCI